MKSLRSPNISSEEDNTQNFNFIPKNKNENLVRPIDRRQKVATVPPPQERTKSLTNTKVVNHVWGPGHRKTTTLGHIVRKIETATHQPSNLFKIKILCVRSIKDYIRNPESLIGTFLVQLLISGCFGFLYFNNGPWSGSYENNHNRAGILFLFGIVLWQTAIISANLLTRQNELFLREVQSGYYTAGPFFLAKYCCEVLPNRFIPLFLYATITYWLSGLWPSFTAWILWLLPMLNIAVASGSILFLYATIFKWETLTQVYILTSLFSFIVVGISPSLHSLLPVISWARWISIPRYAFINHVINEFIAIQVDVNDPTAFMNKTENAELIQDLLLIDKFDMRGYWRNLIIMWIMTIVVIMATYLGMKYKTMKF